MTLKNAATIFVPIWGIWMGIAAANSQDKTTGSAEKQQMLIEPDQLLKTLHQQNMRILDVRPESDYAKGHVPGAVRVDVGDWKTLATSDRGLHDAKGWAAKLSPLGITSKTQVVVYGSRLTDTARIWWLLKYVGVENASLLNGSWDSWAKSNRPAETSTPKIAATEFKPELQADRLEEIDALKKSLKSDKLTVVDTRSDSEFSGGRIPGSAHLEWKELVAEDDRFKPKAQLRELFHKRGIMPDETAVCY